MILRQRIVLDDRVWEIHRHHSFGDSTHVACSQLLVCPACSRPWAMLHLLDEDPFVWPYAAFCGCIPYRDDWRPVPGSILIEEGWGLIDESLLAALPPELVRREFDLHLKAYSQ